MIIHNMMHAIVMYGIDCNYAIGMLVFARVSCLKKCVSNSHTSVIHIRVLLLCHYKVG